MTYPAGRSGKSWPDVTSPPRCRRALAWLGSAMEQVFLGDLFTGIIGFGQGSLRPLFPCGDGGGMDSLRPGDPRRVEHYVLIGRLGAGGMGEVFFGRSRAGHSVAVKLIYPDFADDVEFRRRFRLEVDAGRKVGGFHAAQVVDGDRLCRRTVSWADSHRVPGPPP